jgi:hypothetical protein
MTTKTTLGLPVVHRFNQWVPQRPTLADLEVRAEKDSKRPLRLLRTEGSRLEELSHQHRLLLPPLLLRAEVLTVRAEVSAEVEGLVLAQQIPLRPLQLLRPKVASLRRPLVEAFREPGFRLLRLAEVFRLQNRKRKRMRPKAVLVLLAFLVFLLALLSSKAQRLSQLLLFNNNHRIKEGLAEHRNNRFLLGVVLVPLRLLLPLVPESSTLEEPLTPRSVAPACLGDFLVLVLTTLAFLRVPRLQWEDSLVPVRAEVFLALLLRAEVFQALLPRAEVFLLRAEVFLVAMFSLEGSRSVVFVCLFLFFFE